MQNTPLQNVHGELLEVSVTGAQPLVEADVVALSETPPTGSNSPTTIGHGAIVGAGAGSNTVLSPAIAVSDAAVKPGPLGSPVSSTSVVLSDKRLKVNFGHTFNDESNVVALKVIVPVDSFRADRLTDTSH